MSDSHTVIAIGCIFAMLAVALGAFGAHGLKNVLDANTMQVYQTSVQYHMYHALGLIGIGILMHVTSASLLPLAATLMLVGILLFSGSLYILSMTGMRWLGMVTPFGGVCFLVAWALLAWSFFTATR